MLHNYHHSTKLHRKISWVCCCHECAAWVTMPIATRKVRFTSRALYCDFITSLQFHCMLRQGACNLQNLYRSWNLIPKTYSEKYDVCLTRTNVWESMGKLWSCVQFIKSRTFLLKVMRESVSVLQVTRESVSGTTSHVCVSECAIKLKVRIIKSLSP